MSQSPTLIRRWLRWLGWPQARKSRRRTPRYACSLEGGYTLSASVEGESWPATVRNICVDGLALIVNRPFEEGSPLKVTLQNASKTVTMPIVIRVIYTLEHPTGEWVMGGSFARQLSGAELRTLLS